MSNKISRLLIWLALVCQVGAAAAQDSLVIPLADHVKDGRRVGYWLPVAAAGGRPGFVLLDTGSRGLMLKAEWLGNQPVRWTGRKLTQSFMDGTVFQGEIILAEVRLGSTATLGQVPVMAIKSITCRDGLADCPGRWLSGTPLAGVLGVGLGDAKFLDNPLAHLPDNLSGGYIIHGGGHNVPACLILGLTPKNRQGFVFSPVPKDITPGSRGGTFYDLNAWPGCFSVGHDSQHYFCGRMLFDSGSSWSFLHVPSGSLPGGSLAEAGPPGQRTVSLSIPGLPEYHTTVGQLPWTDRFKVVVDNRGESIIGAGFFTDFDFLYDLRRQAIGIRPAF
jgi:hypothetical protein